MTVSVIADLEDSYCHAPIWTAEIDAAPLFGPVTILLNLLHSRGPSFLPLLSAHCRLEPRLGSHHTVPRESFLKSASANSTAQANIAGHRSPQC